LKDFLPDDLVMHEPDQRFMTPLRHRYPLDKEEDKGILEKYFSPHLNIEEAKNRINRNLSEAFDSLKPSKI